ncbi:M20 family metallo-hydrolase, partial [Clostridioides difficile]|nr:M20 family metallo-hydrolase [Clostridioides difficile]
AGNCPEVGHNALAAAATATLNMLAIPRTGKGASRINIGVLQASWMYACLWS